MSKSMVERVASAIRKKAAEIEHRPGTLDADAMWFSTEFARAAIEAMREPTDAMVNAGHRSADEYDYEPPVFFIFRVMIDAALAEDAP